MQQQTAGHRWNPLSFHSLSVTSRGVSPYPLRQKEEMVGMDNRFYCQQEGFIRSLGLRIKIIDQGFEDPNK